ncbi:hypothetical protein SDC9_93844 [bioreactor metagenome]|uniref:CBS domain-containing protein n=1 Tax=bioreactor metagenome TaxID=1076179 RepID=A0A645A2J0_9ZZZZ
MLRQGALVGVLSDESLMERVRAGGELSAQTVDACCHRDCAFLNFDDMAQHALRILTRRACASMPVFNGDRLVGIVSRNMIEKSGIYI